MSNIISITIRPQKYAFLNILISKTNRDEGKTTNTFILKTRKIFFFLKMTRDINDIIEKKYRGNHHPKNYQKSIKQMLLNQ